MEIEFKIVLPDEASFKQVLRALEERGSGPGSTRAQVNHFFDTEGLALRHGKFALRLREEDSRFRITAKGGAKSRAGDALVTRPEVESEVPADVAREVLRGTTSALDALVAARGGDRPELLTRMQEAIAERGLVHLGSFQNERTKPGRVTIDAGGTPIELQFELDRTTFPGERIERELELEIDDPAHAPHVERWLRTILEELGLPWKTAPSKAQRFFAALSG